MMDKGMQLHNRLRIEEAVIVLVGAPCSGKSYIGKELSKRFNMLYFSSGDIARELDNDVARDGRLAPEDKMRDRIAELFDKHRIFILDGFPRFEDQLSWLDNINSGFHKIIFVVVDCGINELMKRNLNRNREDSTAITERIKWYLDNTVPMIDAIEHEYFYPMVTCTSDDITKLILDIWEVLYAEDSKA